jgi:translation initiation factor IF-1
MSKEDFIKTNGTVVEVCPNSLFRVQLENGATILGHLAGKLRINNININVLDKVQVEISPYDLSKCRIIFRERRPTGNNRPK